MRTRMFAGAGLGFVSLLALISTAVPAGAVSSEAAVPTAAVPKGAVSEAPPSALACGATPSDKDHSAYTEPFKGATNVRSGPSTSCSINGVADTGNKADYFCYVIVDGGVSWTYLRFKDTHHGFVRDDLLKGGGSTTPC